MVLALLVAGDALGEHQRSADDKTNTKNSGGKQSLPLPPITETSYSGLIDERACQPSEDSHQAEFCVAWRTAKAAENQAFWTVVTCWVGVGGIFFVVRTLHYTQVAARAAQISAEAAERAVEESAKTLAHAQNFAERDLRPWLTVEAVLDSRIAVDKLTSRFGEGDKFDFHARLRVQNVGKSAARNVVYNLSGADLGELADPDGWFEATVEDAVCASRACLPTSWRVGSDFAYYNDSLAPSEKHQSRRWCSLGGTAPANRPEWRAYEFCVSVVAAYMGANDDEVFYTAKVFPIGFPEVPVFQRFIGPQRLPIGTGDIAFGPVRKARAI